MTAALSAPDPMAGRAAAAPVLRGPPGRARPRLRGARRRRLRAPGHGVVPCAAVGRRGERRRPAPAPPHADPRGGRARRSRRPDRRPPARHRAADAGGDRSRSGPLAVRRGLGGADARLGRRLRARDRALGDPGRARGVAARARPRPLHARRQRVRPGGVPPAPRRPPRPLAPPPGRRAARLGARRRRRLGPLRRGRPAAFADARARRRCCSTSAASPRSSACRC